MKVMFCPKCGSKNADEAKFCRGCGADVGNVLAVVEGGGTPVTTIAEKHLELFSSGLRNLIVSAGFILVAGLALGISMRLAIATIFLLAFACVFLGTGISRMVQARGLRRLRDGQSNDPATALPVGEPNYIEAPRSIYETGDLAAMPDSVTEHTTRHLRKDEG